MTRRRAIHRLPAVALVALLGFTLTTSPSPAQPARGPVQLRAAPGPVHAGNTWGWYQFGVTRHEFIGPKESSWRDQGPGNVRTQHGMLTLNTTESGTVSTTLMRKAHAYGRWEIRLRSRRYSAGFADFRVKTELVPAPGGAEHCGAENIALEDYELGSDRVKHSIHTLPDHTFVRQLTRNLGNDRWHTFAVEVTPKRISWFVDARLISSETRAEALAPVPRTVRFTMEAADDGSGQSKRMNVSRMQMDWMRYWTLRAPNERSTKAPLTQQGRFRDAC